MSSSLGGVSRRSGLAACRKGPRVSSGPPAMGGCSCPGALPLWTLCSYLGVRGFDPQATGALSLWAGEKRSSDAQHARRRAPPNSGDGDGPSPRSSAPSAARRPQHFHTSCTDGTSVLSGSRRRPTSQAVRPLQGRPEANPTAARSCDDTAGSTHWLPPRAPYTLLSRYGAPLNPPPTALQFDTADQ